jgi:hypothetical protein
MQKTILNVLIALALFLLPASSHAQIITLGTASNFVLFSTAGAVTNSGTGFLTHLTGQVGTNSGSSTGFGNVDGNMHDGDPASSTAAADLLIAYNQLNTATPTAFPSSSLGNGATLLPGVYSIPAAATLTGNLTLNANGNPNAFFIFQVGGALSVAANAKVTIINGGLACNVFWKTEGLLSVGTGSTLRGTFVAHNAAIAMGTLDTLEGRALSINGAVTMNSLMAYTPIGCGSPILTGPVAPTLGAVKIFALFSSIGPVSNSGAITYITGDVGTNLGLTTGYNPLYVNGTVHPVPDGVTAAAVPALTSAYNQLNTLPVDINLLFPAQFGHDLVLTPHTYLLNAATTLTDTVYLNALGNPNAVFVIKINGALSTNTGARIKLVNGTQGKNVYWKVEGAVSLSNNVTFFGTVIANNGAIDITAGAKFRGRALTTTGALTTSGDSIIAEDLLPVASPVTGNPDSICVGTTTVFTGASPGGTWTSNSSNATVNNLGVVTGVSAGVATIRYVVNNAYGTDTGRKNVTVIAAPNAGAISGPAGVCIGSSITLTDPAPGGIWSASNSNATVLNGTVTGVFAGLDTISYSVTSLCGTAAATKIITVSPPATVNTPASQVVCAGSLTAPVNYTGTVSGTIYNWTNNNNTIGLASTGTGDIAAFTAINTTGLPVIATIVVTPTANGCTGASKSFTITTNPTGNVLSVPNQIVCNRSQTTTVIFNSTLPSTAYTWTNNNTSIGLGNSGSGNIPAFTAINNTAAPVIASIIATPTAFGCPGAIQTFTITVNPTPTVNLIANREVCNGGTITPVNFTGAVTGTVFSWSNNNTTIGLNASGTGSIPSFTAVNTTGNPVTATITVTPAANGCTGTAITFTITVNNTPTAGNISLTTPPTVCFRTFFRNFGASTIPPSGINYTWSAINAAISDTGKTGQYALVNFKTVGTATVILTTTVAATGCFNTNGYNVTVTSNMADSPAKVIYFNKSFVCLQNNEEAYTWGYDDAYTLAPTIIAGEMNQDYVNEHPDLIAYNYWVMVTHNGCIQKTYYNKPPNAQLKGSSTQITVSPNPATQHINVVVNTSGEGDISMEIINMMGNRIYAADAVGLNTFIDVSTFPSGIYMVVCHRNGERIFSSRFMKN